MSKRDNLEAIQRILQKSNLPIRGSLLAETSGNLTPEMAAKIREACDIFLLGHWKGDEPDPGRYQEGLDLAAVSDLLKKISDDNPP